MKTGTEHSIDGPIDYSKHELNKCLKMSNDLIFLANRLNQSFYDCAMLTAKELKLLKLLNIAVPKFDRGTFL